MAPSSGVVQTGLTRADPLSRTRENLTPLAASVPLAHHAPPPPVGVETQAGWLGTVCPMNVRLPLALLIAVAAGFVAQRWMSPTVGLLLVVAVMAVLVPFAAQGSVQRRT